MLENFILDIETTGLDPEAKGAKIHCVVLIDIDSDNIYTFMNDYDYVHKLQPILDNAKTIVGHNIIEFDQYWLKMILEKQKYYDFDPRIVDTKLLSQMLHPEQFEEKEEAKKDTPHSLYRWGKKLGLSKQTAFEYEDFSKFTPEMLEQCIRDVELTKKVYLQLRDEASKKYSKETVEMEHKAAHIAMAQSRRGVCFDLKKAQALAAKLSNDRQNSTWQLQKLFKPWYVKGANRIPKRDNKRLGYIEGAEYTPIREVFFNPNSTDHIIYCLKTHYNWEPTEFTKKGKPKVTGEVLDQLPYSECKALAESSQRKKVLGYLSEGKSAWLKEVKDDGRIYGRLYVCGAKTHRMIHHSPNLGQVPTKRKYFGKECRELFIAAPGYVLVGVDASGLEARLFANLIAPFDKGDMARIISEGDIHGKTATTIFGEGYSSEERSIAKQVFFAIIYYARPKKIAKILSVSLEQATKFYEGIHKTYPKVQPFMDAIDAAVAERGNTDRGTGGFVKAIDGRMLPVEWTYNKYLRKYLPEKPLNRRIQADGAIIMKKALTIAYEKNKMLRFVLNVHDEWQVEETPDKAEETGQLLADSIKEAGRFYNLACPLDAEYKIGHNWSQTH